MIYSPYSGNFGNSILQHIMTRIVADRNGYKYGSNPTFSYDYHNGTNQLDFLNLDYGIIHNALFHEKPEGVTNEWHEKYKTITYPNGDSVDYHPFQPDIFSVPDGSKLIIRCCQDEKYFGGYKHKIVEWLKIKPEKEVEYQQTLKDNDIELDDNLVVLNVRGGEYLGVSNLLIRPMYYANAIQEMLIRVPKAKFLVITDDVRYASQLFPNFEVRHFSIGCDYYVLNHSKNLIVSNSSFAIMPVYTNQVVKNILAPKYWSRYNVSTGYWPNGETYFDGWEYMDRDGKVFTYKQIYNEQFLKGLR